MSWAGKKHSLEVALEWLAPIPLALAAGWAGERLGLAFPHALVVVAVAMIAGLALMKLGDGASQVTLRDFEPAEFEPAELDELILEEKDAVLELDDPLDRPGPDARVVRLFERQEATPGELVDRIVDFLADGRRPALVGQPAADRNTHPDASAALHDALANIRASLR